MTDKNELQTLKEFFSQMVEEGEVITEELLNQKTENLTDNKTAEELKKYLESLNISDVEMDNILNWYETRNMDFSSEAELIMDDDLDLDDADVDDGDLIGDDEDFDDVDEEDLLDTDEDFDDVDDEEALLKDLQANYADTPTSKANDAVKMYLKEIGRVPLLKAEEEKKIAQIVQEGDEKVNAKIAELKAKSEETGQDYSDQIKALENQNDEIVKMAKDQLITANLRLVVAIAKKYVGRGLQFLDLIQEGNMGLVKAVEKFDYTKGFKFSTYATWWIRQAITRAIADQARTIRIPVHMVETINKLTRVQRQLVQELGREPTAEEISAKLDGAFTPEKVREIQKIALDPVSLETPIGEEDDSHLGDFIEDKDAMSPDEYATRQQLKDEIDSVLQLLTERERKVLQFRFGLIDGRNRTLEEVGKEFGVTRERIRQIEAKALRKLKHPTKSKRLKDFVDKV